MVVTISSWVYFCLSQFLIERFFLSVPGCFVAVRFLSLGTSELSESSGFSIGLATSLRPCCPPSIDLDIWVNKGKTSEKIDLPIVHNIVSIDGTAT